METALVVLPLDQAPPSESACSKGQKRLRLPGDAEGCGRVASSTSTWKGGTKRKKPKLGFSSSSSSNSKVVDYSNPYAIADLIRSLDSGKYGSVTKDVEELINRRNQVMGRFLTSYPSLVSSLLDGKGSGDEENLSVKKENVVDLEEDEKDKSAANAALAVVIIDSDDDEDQKAPRPTYPFQEVILTRPGGDFFRDPKVLHLTLGGNGSEAREYAVSNSQGQVVSLAGETNIKNERDKGVFVGVEDDNDNSQMEFADDGLGDIWKEMLLALECSKDVAEYSSPDGQSQEDEDYCEHSFVLKDDLGYVCRICGVIERGIETIIDVQFCKVKSNRTYPSDSRNAKSRDADEIAKVQLSEEVLMETDISAHPRHMKEMKPHQLEGFKFLCSNLAGDSPGGCILAHAPGSGKTFMLISFIQSFLAKYPHARPLVVLPKGILPTWKKEFLRWQVEDIPLLDFYSVKADNRLQQLEVLKQWVDKKSILFLGYKQFSSIVCDDTNSKASASCQEILLKRPSLLILDEGHTPRNEDTNMLQSLAKVQTLRKVVLSGTLYQNHVKEVFNILNLVRPKFLRLDTSRSIVKRIMSKVNFSGVRKQFKSDNYVAFYDLVESTIQGNDFRRKVSVIQDLREMTSKVLHYYRGDFLDELPGLVDFTIVLSLSPRQRDEVRKLKKYSRKFKRTSVWSAVSLHPKLKSFSENTSVTDDMMDELLEKLDFKDGVKTKFFLNMLNLCEKNEEKLLVFCQYLTPLKFLERLAAKAKGWFLGREMFVISGESTSEHREWAMDRFNTSGNAKVFFGSIKACGEGISLVGASRIIILDVHLNPSVTRQAIGRAFRPGQVKKVYAYRLVAADSPEEEDHNTCFRKEAVAKMWFEWNEHCGYRDFEVETVDLEECGDCFLESQLIREDVRALYRR